MQRANCSYVLVGVKLYADFQLRVVAAPLTPRCSLDNCIWKEIYDEELAGGIMEAEKSHDSSLQDGGSGKLVL